MNVKTINNLNYHRNPDIRPKSLNFHLMRFRDNR